MGFITESLGFIELMGEFGNGILLWQTVQLTLIFTFFHGLPLIIVNIIDLRR